MEKKKNCIKLITKKKMSIFTGRHLKKIASFAKIVWFVGMFSIPIQSFIGWYRSGRCINEFFKSMAGLTSPQNEGASHKMTIVPRADIIENTHRNKRSNTMATNPQSRSSWKVDEMKITRCFQSESLYKSLGVVYKMEIARDHRAI